MTVTASPNLKNRAAIATPPRLPSATPAFPRGDHHPEFHVFSHYLGDTFTKIKRASFPSIKAVHTHCKQNKTKIQILQKEEHQCAHRVNAYARSEKHVLHNAF